jgi:threonine/homoserine/homoserine lactone efflux protein
MLVSLASGYLLGLGAAVPIGPVNVEIARRTLAGGFRAGFALGCGAVTIDVTLAALTGFGLSQLLVIPGVKLSLQIAGTGLLTYLGIACIVAAVKSRKEQNAAEDPAVSLRQGYLTGLLMTFLNPMTLAFWLIAVPAAGARSQAEALWLICIGVFLGTLSWVVCFAATISVMRRFQRRWWMAAADIVGGCILLFFGGLGGFATLRELAIIR